MKMGAKLQNYKTTKIKIKNNPASARRILNKGGHGAVGFVPHQHPTVDSSEEEERPSAQPGPGPIPVYNTPVKFRFNGSGGDLKALLSKMATKIHVTRMIQRIIKTSFPFTLMKTFIRTA